MTSTGTVRENYHEIELLLLTFLLISFTVQNAEMMSMLFAYIL